MGVGCECFAPSGRICDGGRIPRAALCGYAASLCPGLPLCKPVGLLRNAASNGLLLRHTTQDKPRTNRTAKLDWRRAKNYCRHIDIKYICRSTIIRRFEASSPTGLNNGNPGQSDAVKPQSAAPGYSIKSSILP